MGLKIWGHLEAILRVLELIFGRGGVEHPPPSVIGLKKQVNINKFSCKTSSNECQTVKAFASKSAAIIKAVATCETSNVVYCISCKK